MNSIKLSYFFLIVFLYCACSSTDDDPPPQDQDDDQLEKEFITTVNFAFVEVGNPSNSVYAKWQNPEGYESENDPIITPDLITLQENKEYLLYLELLDESDAENVKEVNKAIIESAEKHQIFFTGELIDQNVLIFSYDDADANGNPLGLESELITGHSDSGVLTLTLIHEPNKNAEGVKDGQIDKAEGEVELQIDLPIFVTPE